MVNSRVFVGTQGKNTQASRGQDRDGRHRKIENVVTLKKKKQKKKKEKPLKICDVEK
jgi:hypothetical protein